jgi:hypothetical protein
VAIKASSFSSFRNNASASTGLLDSVDIPVS